MRNYKIDFLPFKKNYFKFLAFLYIKESISIYFKVFFFLIQFTRVMILLGQLAHVLGLGDT